MDPVEDRSPIVARERSPLSTARKREIARTLDRAFTHGVDGLRTDEWATVPGCRVSFVVGDDRIEIRLRYDAAELPGPVVVPDAGDADASRVDGGGPASAFVDLSAAHAAAYEDLTDAAGRAVDPFAVTVPDSPFARSAVDGEVTFTAALSVLTGNGDSSRQTYDW
ncbi:hypothetical protein [Halobaculum gomorrense]|uniref:Uncharacterized protein n=1 Tax=Halobaculum gomorrense TaxID=43928 RepID=A0A1M5NWN4_9EURY|nr:hypothetical protein [Halobaculum gomorrense]SHG94004.1 hypothetical protein SAMN05443636_1375 [Halobaculum gomorrense]